MKFFKFKMSSETYDTLKEIAMIWLPALATLIVAVFGIWQIPFAEQISGTIIAVDTFLGAILKISNTNYKNEMGEG